MKEWLGIFLCLAIVQGNVVHSGMDIDIGTSGGVPVNEDKLVISSKGNDHEMLRSGLPDDDMEGDDDQSMQLFKEDSVQAGGNGESMKLSGGPIGQNTQASERREDIEEQDITSMVSDDMAPEASGLNAAFDQKEAKLNDAREQLEETKNQVEQQSSQAKRLIKEVYAKQKELHDLQKQILEQTVAVEQQRKQLGTKELEVEQLKAQLQQKMEVQTQAQSAQGVQTAIQGRIQEVDDKVSIAKREQEIKKMYNDLNALQKAAKRHEAELKKREVSLKQKEQAHTAVVSLLELSKDLSDLPEEVRSLVEDPTEDFASIVKSQPPVVMEHKPKLVVTQPATKLNITVVDRSTRDVSTFMDKRPPTYKKKLLAGQAYNAQYKPPTDIRDPRDPDGKCRDSRGDEIECSRYDPIKEEKVPPVVPTISDILSDEYVEEDNGPCVLKCAYHKGPSAATGAKNVVEVNIEIPTQSSNLTIGCPPENNGFPFLSCSLVLDKSDKCESVCVFDGSLNPLKPRFPEGEWQQMLSDKDGSHFGPEAFKSLSHTTYEVRTQTGCKASMKADPLVVCEVRL